ncbi:hypothetical protein COCSADRAFT_195621 [Bipolaris sorokiniana ND90Pr]|uniref:Uncharacterized protein n=1 Tax=Cochliobolus sativus (strain ND90Pr / ATCC 201652) TaxID=665912 RepID=M2SRM7_COCSN|nr:uncharacterized protein COCSADRAFT_195621 [Bipolaris sorokiniana ND90Pr]EMD69893.1 hypothetical protein COCSADRAFT_195621 [Bipolaris sorokiniana ND90Pr]
MSSITTAALSRTQSYAYPFTYPLTRMFNGATTSSSPPPTSSPSNSLIPAKLIRRSRDPQYKTFNSTYINIEMSDLTHTRFDNQPLPTSTDADYYGDDEDNSADMEIIRRDTEEKWKGGQSRSGSASASGSVMGGVKRTVVKMGVSVKNGFRGMVRKFTF